MNLAPTEDSSTLALLDGAASKLAHHLIRLGEAITGPKRTILFVDEIHRFNKAQQDVILPHVENGTVTWEGAEVWRVEKLLLTRAVWIISN